MNIFFAVFAFSMVYLNRNIKRPSIPLCKNCVHYIPVKDSSNFTYGDIGKCSKFIRTYRIGTGEPVYEYAELSRKYSDKCGEDAVLFSDINKENYYP